MEHVTIQSLNGTTVHLSRDGKKVAVRIQAGAQWHKGTLATVDGDTLRLTNGTTVQISPQDAALALHYQRDALTAPVKIPLAIIIVLTLVAIFLVYNFYIGWERGVAEGMAELASKPTSSQE